MNEIIVPKERISVINEVDICVIGGSCTGVFAAVRAARLGAKVAIVEKQNRFGGVAVSSFVNMWHSIYDTDYKEQIIGGLTFEVMERLAKRDAVAQFVNSKSYGVPINSEELAIELDELVIETKIKPYLHTFFSSAITDNGHITAVIVQNKSGRSAIKAKVFIDASGDADLCNSAGLPVYLPYRIQPPTTCARFTGWETQGFDPYKLITEHTKEYNLTEGTLWGTFVPPCKDVYMLNGTRVIGKNPADAEDLTYCEIEGRRQVRAITDIFRKHFNGRHPQLNGLPSCIGIRESRHVHSLYQLKGEDLLCGKRFDDAIANGTYPVDIHHQDKPGLTFKRLDGTQLYCPPGHPAVQNRWRTESLENPKFYQIPLRSLVPRDSQNVIVCGRMLDADEEAFGGVRVMVNLNQTGEAAGIAAYLSVSENCNICSVDFNEVRKNLGQGGSCII